MKLINIGFGNFVSDIKILAITNSDSAPIKRIMQEAKAKSMLIDATYGRHCKTAILTESGHVILSALSADVIEGRVEQEADNGM